MFCPNCMSPYVKPWIPDDPEEAAALDEPMLECPECNWLGEVSEFLPENYR